MIIIVDNIAVKWAPKQRNKNKNYLLLDLSFYHIKYKPSEFPSSNFGSMKLYENRKTFSSAFTFIRIIFMFLIWWLMILLWFSLVWVAFLLLRNVFPSKSLFFDSLLFYALLFEKKNRKRKSKLGMWWTKEDFRFWYVPTQFECLKLIFHYSDARSIFLWFFTSWKLNSLRNRLIFNTNFDYLSVKIQWKSYFEWYEK